MLILASVTLLALVVTLDFKNQFSYLLGIPLVNFCTIILTLMLSNYKDVSLLRIDSKPVVYIGKISYGIYLWHYPILIVVGRRLGDGWNWLVIILTLIAAAISFRYFETYFLRLKSRFAAR